MHMPVTYDITSVNNSGDNLDLELVNSDNYTDTLKIRLKQSIPPQKIKSCISIPNESDIYISYFFNLINDNGTLGDPIQLSSVMPDTEIAWENTQCFPKQLLYINEFRYIE